MRPRVQIPGPRPKIVFKSRSSPAPSGARGSQGGHRCSWKWVAAAPSKWISNRQLNSLTAIAQPIYQGAHGKDREAPGFENQRRCPRRCAADAQVRIVRRPVQNPKVCRLGQESRSTVRIRYNNSGLRGVVGAAPQGCGGPRCQAHDPRRGVIPNRRVSRKWGDHDVVVGDLRQPQTC